VIAMMRGPPDRAALHGRGADHAEQELRHARGLEGLVGEIAVVEAGDREHPQEVERHANDEGDRAHAHHEHEQAGRVHQDERQRAQPVDAVSGGMIRVEARCAGRVEPVQNRCAHSDQRISRGVRLCVHSAIRSQKDGPNVEAFGP
jgi:hypothetical protein